MAAAGPRHRRCGRVRHGARRSHPRRRHRRTAGAQIVPFRGIRHCRYAAGHCGLGAEIPARAECPLSAFDNLNEDYTLVGPETIEKSKSYKPVMRLSEAVFPFLEWVGDQVPRQDENTPSDGE